MEKQYYIVDKASGKVVGETNSPREPKRPFLCFLSWLVFYLCILITRFLAYQYLRLVFFIHGAIYDFSKILYFIIIYGGGCVGLGFLITLLVTGGRLSYALSEKVRPSEHGTRYLVIGVIICIGYLVSLITMIVGKAEDTSLFQYVWHIIVLLFSIGLSVFCKNAKKEQ